MKRIFYTFLLTMLVLSTSVFAQNKKLVFCTATDYETTGKDVEVIEAIAAQGGYDIEINKFAVMMAEDLPQLNGADVVIMGRSIGSGDIGGDAKDIWDQVTSPVLSMCLWGLRNSRALWFDTGTAAHLEMTDEEFVTANILVEDPVFDGMTGSFNFWAGRYDYLDVTSAGNGTILAATPEGWPLLARWEAGKEFYEGCGQIPQGPRSYIGLGIDDGNVIDYFSFTDEGKKVFFNELARLAGGTSSTNGIADEVSKISVIANSSSVTISMNNLNRVEIYSLDGKKMVSETSQANTLELSSALQTGVYIVKAFDNSGAIATEKFIVR